MREAVHDLLGLLEPGDATRAALDVLDQGAEDVELRLALGTVVHLALMHGALEVGVEALELAEGAMAEVAFVPVSVPGGLGGPGVDGAAAAVAARVFEQPQRHEVLRVERAHVRVDLLPRRAGPARAGFEMDRHGRNGRKGLGASGTLERPARVEGRTEVLIPRVSSFVVVIIIESLR